MRLVVKLAQFVWELPQTSLGALLFGSVVAVRQVEGVRRARAGSSCERKWTRAPNRLNPVGFRRFSGASHALKSRKLGAVYLPLVGVPSVMRVVYGMGYRIVRGRRWAGHYRGYPELQADKLGGVDRRLRPRP